VPVPSQESERSCISVLVVLILTIFKQFQQWYILFFILLIIVLYDHLLYFVERVLEQRRKNKGFCHHANNLQFYPFGI